MNVHDIADRYEPFLPGCILMEFLDLFVLDEFVSGHYTPSEEPLVMCAGGAHENMAAVMEAFHLCKYGIETTRVAACNIANQSLIDEEALAKYTAYFEGLLGHGENAGVWVVALGKLTEPTRPFDITYVRNPDLCRVDEWLAVFDTALTFTAESGVVVAVTQRYDSQYLGTLAGLLKESSGADPAFSGPTGIDWADSPSSLSILHDSVAIWNGKGGYRTVQ